MTWQISNDKDYFTLIEIAGLLLDINAQEFDEFVDIVMKKIEHYEDLHMHATGTSFCGGKYGAQATAGAVMCARRQSVCVSGGNNTQRGDPQSGSASTRATVSICGG